MAEKDHSNPRQEKEDRRVKMLQRKWALAVAVAGFSFPFGLKEKFFQLFINRMRRIDNFALSVLETMKSGFWDNWPN